MYQVPVSLSYIHCQLRMENLDENDSLQICTYSFNHDTITIRFLGLKIDSTLTWREHVTELTPKLNKACCVIRTLMFLRSLEILRMVYFSYFHSIMSYGIIFWGNSHSSINIFKIQKRIIRIMTKSNNLCQISKRYKKGASKHNTLLRCNVSQDRQHVSALYSKAIIRSDK